MATCKKPNTDSEKVALCIYHGVINGLEWSMGTIRGTAA